MSKTARAQTYPSQSLRVPTSISPGDKYHPLHLAALAAATIIFNFNQDYRAIDPRLCTCYCSTFKVTQPFHTLYTLTSSCEILWDWVKFDAILQFINPLSLIWTSHSVISSPTQYIFSCCAWVTQASLSDVWVLEEFSRFEEDLLFVLSITVCRTVALSDRTQFSLLSWSLIPLTTLLRWVSMMHYLPYWDEYLWCTHIIIRFKLNLTLLFQLYSVQMAMVHIDLLCLLYFYLKLAYLLELLGAFLVCEDFNISIDCGIQHSRCALDNLSPASSHIHRLSLCQPVLTTDNQAALLRN